MQVSHSNEIVATVAVNYFCMSSISRCSTFAVLSVAATAAACNSIYIMDICVASIAVTITVIVCQLDVYFMRYMYISFQSCLIRCAFIHILFLSLCIYACARVYVSLQSFLFTVLKLI